MKQTVAMLAILLSIGLAGCAPTTLDKMNNVSIGMDKQQVISAMGSPTETRAAEGVEYLVYHLRTHTDIRRAKKPYFVKLQNGQVTAYGEIGDFGSTQTPESTVNINQTVKTVE